MSLGCCRSQPQTDSDDEANLKSFRAAEKQTLDGSTETGYGTFTPTEVGAGDDLSLASVDSGIGADAGSLDARHGGFNLASYEVIPEEVVLAEKNPKNHLPDLVQTDRPGSVTSDPEDNNVSGKNAYEQSDVLENTVDGNDVIKTRSRAISIPRKEDVLSNLGRRSMDADIASDLSASVADGDAAIEPEFVTGVAGEPLDDELHKSVRAVGDEEEIQDKRNHDKEKSHEETPLEDEKETPAFINSVPDFIEDTRTNQSHVGEKTEKDERKTVSSDESPASGSSKVPDFRTNGDVISGEPRIQQGQDSDKEGEDAEEPQGDKAPEAIELNGEDQVKSPTKHCGDENIEHVTSENKGYDDKEFVSPAQGPNDAKSEKPNEISLITKMKMFFGFGKKKDSEVSSVSEDGAPTWLQEEKQTRDYNLDATIDETSQDKEVSAKDSKQEIQGDQDHPNIDQDGSLIFGAADEHFVTVDGVSVLVKDGKLVLGEDGKPIYGEDGRPIFVKDGKLVLGEDDKPILREDSNPILAKDGKLINGEDGKSILGKDGRPIVIRDGKLILGEDDTPTLGEDGKPFIVEDGSPILIQDGKLVLGEDGKPIYGEDGRPIFVKDGKLVLGEDDKPILREDGNPILAKDGKLMNGEDGKPILGKDGRPIVIRDGKLILGEDDTPTLGEDGKPFIVEDGSPILIQDGKLVLGEDGKLMYGEDGRPIFVKDGKLVIGKDDKPILREDGNPILAKDGKLINGEDGKPIIGKDGRPIVVRGRRLTLESLEQNVCEDDDEDMVDGCFDISETHDVRQLPEAEGSASDDEFER